MIYKFSIYSFEYFLFFQTFVLFHLPHIRCLDSLEMTDDAKRYAEATFMKKKMYYNMRIKTIKRLFSNIIQLGFKALMIKKDQLNQKLSLMNKALVLIEDDQELKLKIKGKYLLIQQYRDYFKQEITHTKEIFEIIKSQMIEKQDLEIKKLIVELETGGNIRF